MHFIVIYEKLAHETAVGKLYITILFQTISPHVKRRGNDMYGMPSTYEAL